MNQLKLKFKFVTNIWETIRMKGSWTELAGILKPFIYILSIVKYGSNSMYPIGIAFLFHIVSLMTSIRP